jgi:hypothetical protein
VHIRSNRTVCHDKTRNAGGEQLDDGIGDTLVSVGAISNVFAFISVRASDRARCPGLKNPSAERGRPSSEKVLEGDGKFECKSKNDDRPGYAENQQNFGGRDRDRTGDPLLAKQVLSQLSYTPTAGTTFDFKAFAVVRKLRNIIIYPLLCQNCVKTPVVRSTLRQNS